MNTTSNDLKEQIKKFENSGVFDARIVGDMIKALRSANNALLIAENRIKTFDKSNYVRVLRVIEYSGTHKDVEEQITDSLHGTRIVRNGTVTIKASTIGLYPEKVEEEIDDRDGDWE